MAVYDISYNAQFPGEGNIDTITLFPHWGFPGLLQQVVWENGKLVESVFNHRKAYYSVEGNKGLFPDPKSYGILINHHSMLREMCALGSKETGKVTSLIQGFTITDKSGVSHVISADENPLNPSLLVYWLAEGRDDFIIDNNTIKIVESYFHEDLQYLDNEDRLLSDKQKTNYYKFIRFLMQEGNIIRVSR